MSAAETSGNPAPPIEDACPWCGGDGRSCDGVGCIADEVMRLRHALVFWNNDHSGDFDGLREEIADLLERNGDDVADRPYHFADLIIAAVGAKFDKVDQTLYDVIPEGEWGIKL